MELRVTDVHGNCNYVVSRIYRGSVMILPFQEGVDRTLSVSHDALVNRPDQRSLKCDIYIIWRIPTNFLVFDKYIEN